MKKKNNLKCRKTENVVSEFGFNPTVGVGVDAVKWNCPKNSLKIMSKDNGRAFVHDLDFFFHDIDGRRYQTDGTGFMI